VKDKEKLIRDFEASGNGGEARRMIDLAEQVQAGRPYRVTDFMSPAGLVIADAVKANFGGITIISSGGYEGAERLRAGQAVYSSHGGQCASHHQARWHC